MTIKSRSYSELTDKIGTCAKTVSEFSLVFLPNGLVHETACETLLHAQTHGDVTLCQRLYEAIGGTNNKSDRGKSMVKAEALKAWYAKMGPLTARNGNWGLKDKWTKDQFKLDTAEQTPIVEFAPEEQRIVTVYAGSILTRIENMLPRINEAFQANLDGKPHFAGSLSKSEAFLKDVLDFAKKRAAQENPADLGLLEANNTYEKPENKPNEGAHEGDRLIRNGVEIPPEQAVA